MPLCPSHLHHVVPGAVESQLPQPVDEALAGLAVDSARFQHGLTLFHKLDDKNMQWNSSWTLNEAHSKWLTAGYNQYE